MLQTLFHLWGDYVTQSHWMANKKTLFTKEGWLACFVHATLYSAPFAFIASGKALTVIFLTHFFIDKFRLAKYVNAFKNGTANRRGWDMPITNTGYPSETPVWLATWLLFITDNILHVTINYLSLRYL